MHRPALALLVTAALLAGACSSEPPAVERTAEAPAAATPPAVAAAAATDAPPAATPAKNYRPVKGEATIEVIRGASRRVGQDMVTLLKIRNTSEGRINLLRVDEYWYDKDMKDVTGSREFYRQPFNPGDVIEITLKSPVKPNLYTNTFSFSHANGSVTPKEVKAFEEK
ncbi:MAG TPA: hypothetical protein VML55_16315 [Planctomycetaceae bacterium]|nr:hypothetical protein [Planctomycetaceae bacterium]